MPMLVRPVANRSGRRYPPLDELAAGWRLAGRTSSGNSPDFASSLSGTLRDTTIAMIAITTLQAAPTRNVPRNPSNSIRIKGRPVPTTAPATLAMYRKLNDREDSLGNMRPIASMATGIVAPINVHQGINVRGTQITE